MTLSRRELLAGGLASSAVVLSVGLSACGSGEPATSNTVKAPASPPDPGKVLLVFFSRPGENYYYGGRRDLEVGNTDVLAKLIADRIDCDTYRIEAVDPYPDAYEEAVERNVREQDADARPAIANPLPDVGAYDTVLLGSPVWNVRAPMIMWTFTDGVDLAGKTVLPFVTYAVSGIGDVEDDYRSALPDSDVGTGLAVLGETVADAGRQVDRWLTASALT